MGWFDGRSDGRSSRHSPYSTHHSRHSAPSVFSFGSSGITRHSSSSSWSRRARPRAGFIQRVIYYIRRVLRDIWRYARRNRAKVFFLVIVPLLTSGVLPKLLSMIGVHLPPGLLGGKLASAGGAGGLSEGAGGLMKLAKDFL